MDLLTLKATLAAQRKEHKDSKKQFEMRTKLESIQHKLPKETPPFDADDPIKGSLFFTLKTILDLCNP
jgi:hypothetical protein